MVLYNEENSVFKFMYVDYDGINLSIICGGQ